MSDRSAAPPPAVESDGEHSLSVKVEISLRTMLLVLVVVAGVFLFLRLWAIMLVILFALIFAGALGPVVTRLQRARLPRGLALGIPLLTIILAVIGTGVLVIPPLAQQIVTLVDQIPALQTSAADFMTRIPLLAGQAETVRSLDPGRFTEPLGRAALGYASNVIALIVYTVTTFVLAIYLVADSERAIGFLYSLVSRKYHLRLAQILLHLEEVVGGYVRGQALTSLSMGVFVFLLLTIMGVPNALAIAVFAAFADLIPFIGGLLVTTPAVLVTLPNGLISAGIVWIALVIYQEFESRFLVPRIYGKTLRLSPVAVLISLLIGGELLGIVGALLALPLAAGLRVLVQDLRIDLPGEQPAEAEERRVEEHAEARFAAESEGSSPVESAELAVAMAREIHADEAAREQTGLAIEKEEEPEGLFPDQHRA